MFDCDMQIKFAFAIKQLRLSKPVFTSVKIVRQTSKADSLTPSTFLH